MNAAMPVIIPPAGMSSIRGYILQVGESSRKGDPESSNVLMRSRGGNNLPRDDVALEVFSTALTNHFGELL